jgi:hypothetical protein
MGFHKRHTQIGEVTFNLENSRSGHVCAGADLCHQAEPALWHGEPIGLCITFAIKDASNYWFMDIDRKKGNDIWYHNNYKRELDKEIFLNITRILYEEWMGFINQNPKLLIRADIEDKIWEIDHLNQESCKYANQASEYTVKSIEKAEEAEAARKALDELWDRLEIADNNNE